MSLIEFILREYRLDEAQLPKLFRNLAFVEKVRDLLVGRRVVTVHLKQNKEMIVDDLSLQGLDLFLAYTNSNFRCTLYAGLHGSI